MEANESSKLWWVYWLIPAAFILHDTEELVMMPGWIATHRSELELLLGRLGAGDVMAALPSTFVRAGVAIGCVLAVFIVITAGAALWSGSQRWRWLYAGLLGVFFLHAFTHIGQTIMFSSYTPGVVTAVAIVIPVSLYVYKKLLAARVLEWSTALMAAGAAFALFVPAVLLALLFSAWLTSSWSS